jgi:hypothetical protein
MIRHYVRFRWLAKIDQLFSTVPQMIQSLDSSPSNRLDPQSSKTYVRSSRRPIQCGIGACGAATISMSISISADLPFHSVESSDPSIRLYPAIQPSKRDYLLARPLGCFFFSCFSTLGHYIHQFPFLLSGGVEHT